MPHPNPMSEQVLDRFRFHPATASTGPAHQHIRDLFGSLAGHLLECVPPGRHQSLALTSLQEAMMWANAAIAIDSPHPSDSPSDAS